MNWVGIKEGIRQAVALALGLEADVAPGEGGVLWMNSAAAGTWRDSPRVDLVLRTPRGLGVDEVRHSFNAGEDKLEKTHSGPREFLVSVRIEAESQEAAEESVGVLASTLRTRLRREGVLALLRAQNVALVRIEPTAEADLELDGRMVSLSVTDVVFSSTEADQDSTASGDYIQTVELSSDSLDVDPFTVTGS